MTYPVAGSISIGAGEPFTVDDLFALPDDGNRYEIFDGSLVLSPPPATRHVFVTLDLRTILVKAAPDGFLVVTEGAGIYPTDRDFYIPDILVLSDASRTGNRRGFPPDEVLLAVEVVSPGNPSNDHVWKRRNYAKFGIRHYWIADPRDRTLRILELGEDGSYVDKELLEPGQSWKAIEPFEVTIDPAEIFRS